MPKNGMTLKYDCEQVTTLLSSAWAEKVQWLERRESLVFARPGDVQFLSALLDDAARRGGIWHIPERPSLRVCVQMGRRDTSGRLRMSLRVESSIEVVIEELVPSRELPAGGLNTVPEVLDYVCMHCTDGLRKLSAMLTPPPADLALQFMPVDVVRGEVIDDPNLDEVERQAIHGATDDAIANAVLASWPYVEDQFYDLHDSLQELTKRALLAGPECREGR
ncbi:hypothetical protein [Rhodococcus pyridinivorans]|uniref:hypothetical protein n=1 Tax=Rhodococcus pyridinivorans TaxID=103816 RepID=UPI002659705E|nr:hypothetical protein [Rhodococcus pyridinivorans]